MTRIVLALWLAAFGNADQDPVSVPAQGFENLSGFTTVVVNQVNNAMGSERLPSAGGLPIEPGLYVTLSLKEGYIFDRPFITYSNGALQGSTFAKECRSGCSKTAFDAFHFTWRRLAGESGVMGIGMPSRVLLAADATLPATTLLDAAYAASETRPQQVPSLHLLVNGGKASMRARPFFLVPPKGMRVPPGQRILGLKVEFLGNQKYRITAADPRFGRTLEAEGQKQLKAMLRDIKKRYPNKESIILRPGPSTTVGDLVQVMLTAQKSFPRPVLSAGQRVLVG